MVSRIERNIVKEILRECFPKNIHPNEDFVMYFLKLLLLDPNWGITENLLGSRSNVQNLVKYIISELMSKDSIRMMTLKMQYYFKWSLDHLQDVVTLSKNTLKKRLSPMKREIMSRKPESPTQFENLRRIIVLYAIFISGLGNPMKDAVYAEGAAALKSIINDEELKEFVQSPKEEKIAQIQQITKIIAGVRLFNKYCKKGGVDIPDLPTLYKNASKLVKEDMESTLGRVLNDAGILTVLFEKCYVLKKNEDNEYYLDCVATPKLGKEYLERAKEQLIHLRQYELFIRKVIHYLQALDVEVDNIEEEIAVAMENMLKIVQARLAVPITIIFPLFEELSDHWTALQEHVIVLARYGTIVTNLEIYCKTMQVSADILDDLIDSASAHSEDEILMETVDLTLESENPEVKIFQANQIPNAESVDLQYLGFCGWKLIEGDGILIPGNPGMGVAKFKDDYFVFTSREASDSFAKKPQEFTNHVLHLARKRPQLINFLLLEPNLIEVSEVLRLIEEKVKVTKVADKSIQLEASYVIPPIKDIKISWNVWDYKRLALKLLVDFDMKNNNKSILTLTKGVINFLPFEPENIKFKTIFQATLTRCKTKSTQTLKSHSRNVMRMQTIILTDHGIQTLQDQSTSVPTPSAFIYGLRGRKDENQFVLNITRPVHE